jgi:SAM-dependent methyltransferase
MTEHRTTRICKSYDQIADEYVRRIFHELDAKPLDQELVNRFARQLRGRGEVCDMGCGPGHVAQYLKNLGANVFGLDISPAMLEQARRLNPDILFREGDMLALDLPDSKLAGIVAFYAIVNTPKELLSDIFRQMFRCYKLAVCSCSHFISGTKSPITRSCGSARLIWTFSISSQRTSGVC